MRQRIEATLEIFGHGLYRHAYWVIAGVLIVLAMGMTQIPKIEIRASVDEFLRSDDPIRVKYDAFLERFGRDDMIMLAIEPPEVFDLGFLEKLRRLHEELEDDVPHAKEVQSLINARETRGVDDGLVVGELLERWPQTDSELEDLRDRALANPLYRGFLLSEDGRQTTIAIELEAFSEFFDSGDALGGFDEAPSGGETAAPSKLAGGQEAEAIRAVDEIIARYADDDFRIHAGGAPVLNAALMASMVSDIVLFTALSTALIALFLALVFRRAVGVIVPLSVALLSLLATLCVMGAFGLPAMPISEVIPSFLLSVGVGSAVHLIVIFQQRVDAGATKEQAIAASLAHSGLPIIMTGLTTAGGIASFAAADLVPIAMFGIVAPLGILITLGLTLTLSPALLAVLPMARSHGSALAGAEATDPARSPSIRLLTRIGAFATANAARVVVASGILVALAIAGIAQLRISFDTLAWFPEELPAKVASKIIDTEFGGSMGLELIVDSREENGLHDPALLQSITRARQTVTGLQMGPLVAGRSVSIVDIVEEIHQALNEGRPEARAIPDDRKLVSQELILFENSGSDDLEDLVDSQFRLARFTLRVPMADGSLYPAIGKEVERIFEENVGGRADLSLTGMMVVMGRSFTASIDTLLRSYSIALLVITPLMMLLLGSLRLGLIAMIPNLFPIVLTLGLMGWVGIPIEMFSLLVGSVALGLAVDDTIHFMHGFRRCYASSGNVDRAVRETLETTGQALLFTSVVLSMGFFIYVLSDLSNLRSFGALTAFAIVMAFLADVLLGPALMTMTARFSSIRTELDAARD